MAKKQVYCIIQNATGDRMLISKKSEMNSLWNGEYGETSLVNQAGQYAPLAGGRIEAGETSKKAAARELKEECGIDIINDHPKTASTAKVISFEDGRYSFDLVVYTAGEDFDFIEYTIGNNIDVTRSKTEAFQKGQSSSPPPIIDGELQSVHQIKTEELKAYFNVEQDLKTQLAKELKEQSRADSQSTSWYGMIAKRVVLEYHSRQQQQQDSSLAVPSASAAAAAASQPAAAAGASPFRHQQPSSASAPPHGLSVPTSGNLPSQTQTYSQLTDLTPVASASSAAPRHLSDQRPSSSLAQGSVAPTSVSSSASSTSYASAAAPRPTRWGPRLSDIQSSTVSSAHEIQSAPFPAAPIASAAAASHSVIHNPPSRGSQSSDKESPLSSTAKHLNKKQKVSEAGCKPDEKIKGREDEPDPGGAGGTKSESASAAATPATADMALKSNKSIHSAQSSSGVEQGEEPSFLSNMQAGISSIKNNITSSFASCLQTLTKSYQTQSIDSSAEEGTSTLKKTDKALPLNSDLEQKPLLQVMHEDVKASAEKIGASLSQSIHAASSNEETSVKPQHLSKPNSQHIR